MKKPPLLAAMQEDTPRPNFWRKEGVGYIYRPCAAIEATLLPDAAGWVMRLVVSGKSFRGHRPKLIDAHRAVSDLLYIEAKQHWLKMRSEVITLAPENNILED